MECDPTVKCETVELRKCKVVKMFEKQQKGECRDAHYL